MAVAKSKILQRHMDSLKELKDPKLPTLKLRKVPVLKENPTSGQVKKYSEAVAKNEQLTDDHQQEMARYNRAVERNKRLRGVRMVDGKAIFGSSYRLCRTSLVETEFLKPYEEGDGSYTEKFTDLFKTINRADSNPLPVWPVKELVDFFYPIQKELDRAKFEVTPDGFMKVSQTYPYNLNNSDFIAGTWRLKGQTFKEVFEEMAFTVNVKYVYEMLRFAKQLGISELTLHFTSPVYPLYFTGGDDFEYVITPIRSN